MGDPVTLNDIKALCRDTSKNMSALMQDALQISKSVRRIKEMIVAFEKQQSSKPVTLSTRKPTAKPNPPPGARRKPTANAKPATITARPPVPPAGHFIVCRRVPRDPQTQQLKEPLVPKKWASMVLVPSGLQTVSPASIMFIGQVMREATEAAAAGRETVYVYRVSVQKKSVVPYKTLSFQAGSPLGPKSGAAQSVTVNTKRLMMSPPAADGSSPPSPAIKVESTETLRSFVESNMNCIESFLQKQNYLAGKRPSAPPGSDAHARRILSGILQYANV